MTKDSWYLLRPQVAVSLAEKNLRLLINFFILLIGLLFKNPLRIIMLEKNE